MGCLRLENLENYTSLRVLKGGKSSHQNIDAGVYCFGYNGMEKDKEIKGDGNSYTTEFRQYDPRLGRWLSLDPLMAQLSEWSPYVAFNNSPVSLNDPSGLIAGDPPKRRTNSEGYVEQQREDGTWGEIEYQIPEVVITPTGGGTTSVGKEATTSNATSEKLDNSESPAASGLSSKATNHSSSANNGAAWSSDVAATDANGKYLDGHGMFYRDESSPYREIWDKNEANCFGAKHLAYFAGVSVVGGVAIFTSVVSAPIIVSFGVDAWWASSALYGTGQYALNATLTKVAATYIGAWSLATFEVVTGYGWYSNYSATYANPSSLIRTETGRTWSSSTQNVANIMNSARSNSTGVLGLNKISGINQPVQVYQFNGNNYILNGHHRVNAAIRLNQPVPIQFVSSPNSRYSSHFDLVNDANNAMSNPFKVDGRMLNTLLK